MKNRIWNSRLWAGVMAVCMILTGCRSETSEYIATEQNLEYDSEGETETQLQELAEAMESGLTEEDKESYEAFLRGEAAALYGDIDKKIWQLIQRYTVYYSYCDVDGDDREELCIGTSKFFYVIKNKDAGLAVLFEGPSCHYPIHADGFSGIIYWEMEDYGDAPKKEIYHLSTLNENGETEEILNFAWNDKNEDGDQNEGDQYLYEQEELSMQEWLDVTEQYRYCGSWFFENWETCEIDGSEGRSVVLENYAIYPTRITEENPPSNAPYVVWPMIVNLQFPQIYYSREDEEFDGKKQVRVNQKLLEKGVPHFQDILVERKTLLENEYDTDYMITMADEHMISIKYDIYAENRSHYNYLCNGITLNVDTGERMKVTDYINVDETLIEGVKNGSIRCCTGYTQEYIIAQIESFLEFFDEEDMYDCFYLDEKYVYLIVHKSGGNINYIILKINRSTTEKEDI